ncbi:MAG: aldose 1-epimerase family protein, partial [Planctomycetes bacterium]|nr:aldose 1-epimerase family protein [Planctomycetota bacterium]
ADGVKAIEVDTGLLKFESLPSRCLDIPRASFKGVPFAYLTKSGIRHPAYFSKRDPEAFLENFFAGVLTTCGLHNIGGPSEYQGVQHQLHGEIANMAAEKVCVKEEWSGDDCLFTISGEVHFSRFYAHDMILRRTISTKLGANSFTVEDEVENLDFAPSACLLLYHSQFGYPFLDSTTKLISSPIAKTAPRPGVTEEQAENFGTFDPPSDGREEECYYHTFKPDAQGRATACLFNPVLGEKGMGVYIRYDTSTLPYFIQWKMLRSREYVCGLEPASAALEDRTDEMMKAVTLQPLEKRKFKLEIGVLEGEDACKTFAGAK